MSNRSPRALFAALAAATVATVVGCGAAGTHLPLAKAASSTAAEIFAAGQDDATVIINYTSRAQLIALSKLGIELEGFDLDHKRVRTTVRKDQLTRALPLGVTVTADPASSRNHYDPAYKTYVQTKADLQAMAAQHPDLCELVDVGDGWEKTQHKADRDILALHIGKKGAGKPVVLFAGCHHARELVTPEIVMNMAHQLVDGYGSDAESTGLVNTRDIWLVPMVNPDGHALAELGNDQRKNTDVVSGGKRRIGVDLNRNYGAPQWGIVGCSTEPESDTFCGKSAFSEPEVASMRDLMRQIKPVYLLTFHSYSNDVLWPWGYTDAPPPDDRLALVGKQMGKLSGYKSGQSGPFLYPTSGDDTDFAFSELGTLAYTIEVGSWNDNFDPSFSKMAQFWKENQPMMMLTLRTADNPRAAAGPDLNEAGSRVASREFFLDAPGKPGSGKLQAPAVGNSKRLVWGHAKDAKGTWGPWSISWSR